MGVYANELIEAAEYHLANAKKNYPEPIKIWKTELFSILCSCRAAIDVLLFDYAENYVLGPADDKKMDVGEFRKLARAKNPQALKFLDWYVKERDSLLKDNDVCEYFLKYMTGAAQLAFHKRPTGRPKSRAVFVGSTTEKDNWKYEHGDKGVPDRVNDKDFPGEDATEVWERLVTKVKKFVNDAQLLFP